MKSAGKLIAFVASYTVVAYLVLAVLAITTDSDITAVPTLVAALLVAMVTVLFDEKGAVSSRSRAVVFALLLPVTAAWLYFAYHAVNADFPDPGYLWRPLVCVALFVTPTLIGRRLRRQWRGRRR